MAGRDGASFSKLDFGQFSSAARDAEHRITLNDLVSALEHELHAAEVPECRPPPFDPQLLKLLSLEGTIVTVDALNCQRAIAQQIIDQGGRLRLRPQGQSGHAPRRCRHVP